MYPVIMVNPSGKPTRAAGARLEAERIARGFATRASFARHLGVIPMTVTNWEARGQTPQSAQLRRIAEALDLPSSEPFLWFGQTPPAEPSHNVTYLPTSSQPTEGPPPGTPDAPSATHAAGADALSGSERKQLLDALTAGLTAGHVTEDRWLEAAGLAFALLGLATPRPPRGAGSDGADPTDAGELHPTPLP